MEKTKEFDFFYKGDERISVVCEENNNGFLIYPVKNGNRVHGVSTYINDLSDSSCKEGINKLSVLYLELDELSKRSKMSESEKLLFHKRIVDGGVLISADGYINPVTTQSLAEVNVTEPLLYERISQYAYLNGEDLQGLFQTKEYLYMSCFIRDVADFKSSFGNDESLKPLFNHGKGDVAAFLISFPEKLNYANNEIIKNFINIIQGHVDGIDDELWKEYSLVTITGDAASNLSRKELVKTNVLDFFEKQFYVNRLLNHSQTEKIGSIGDNSVYFNPVGYYFYWNPKTEFILESWLTLENFTKE